MDATSTILIGVIIITGNFLQYLLHSRCKSIKTPCCEIERDVMKEKNDDNKNNNNNLKLNEINIKDL